MSSVSGMSLHMCWIPLDHATEGTQEVTPDLSLPVSQTGVQDNSDLNTSGSPRGLLLKGNLATPLPTHVACCPKELGRIWKTSTHRFQGLQNAGGKEKTVPRRKLKELLTVFTLSFPFRFPKTPKSTSTQASPTAPCAGVAGKHRVNPDELRFCNHE